MGRIRLGRFVHDHFLALLIAAYALAAIWPWLGEVAKEITLAKATLFRESVVISLPMLLLAVLLFNAGLGADAKDLANAARRPRVVLVGLVANVLLPVALLFLLFQALRNWHDPNEVQVLFLGLIVVAAMPIAGSSTAWSQNANGNTAVSLGLVILSTLLSPWTTWFTLTVMGTLATGDSAEILSGMSGRGTGLFLLFCVIVPSLSGISVRLVLGKARVTRCKPAVKLGNSIVLLILCYINASTTLPMIVADPDWDFLAMAVAAVTVMCTSAFLCGWLLARWMNADEPQRRSLMFGLGMNNNGTGLVMAGASLGSMPIAILPVLVYNLVQHLVAGGVSRLLSGRQEWVSST